MQFTDVSPLAMSAQWEASLSLNLSAHFPLHVYNVVINHSCAYYMQLRCTRGITTNWYGHEGQRKQYAPCHKHCT